MMCKSWKSALFLDKLAVALARGKTNVNFVEDAIKWNEF